MEQKRRQEAEILVKKILQEKSFLNLTQEDKTLLFDVYDDDMKVASKNYNEYLLLPESERLVNIVILVLKEYIGSWHVTPSEMEEISEYLKDISKLK